MSTSIHDVIKAYTNVFLLEDENVIPLAIAVAISGKLPGDPLWLMIVGPSSGGKSEIINAVDCGIDWVHQISTITTNTFLSGMVVKQGAKDPSLLKRIGSGTLAFKDFTSIISLAREVQQVLFAQLREIFDGRMVKETGAGKPIEWVGKISLIAGVTESIHLAGNKYAGMGTRAMMYTLPVGDRQVVTKRAFDNAPTIATKRNEVRKVVRTYIEELMATQPNVMPVIPPDKLPEVIELADFASRARSATERGFKGELMLVLSEEMPMRLVSQLANLGSVLMWMYGEWNDVARDLIRKLALDSIPKQRRMVLRVLAEYDTTTTKGVATKLSYPTDTVRQWLEDITALGMSTRTANPGNKGDIWTILPQYREIMRKYDNVPPTGGNLESSDDGTDESAILATPKPSTDTKPIDTPFLDPTKFL